MGLDVREFLLSFCLKEVNLNYSYIWIFVTWYIDS